MTALPDSSNATVEFDLRVRERKPRWIVAGLGSSTSERFRLTGEWGHRNLGGRSIQGALNGQLSLDSKGRFLLARGEGSLLEPWVFGGLVTPYYEKGVDRTDTSWVRRYDARGIRFELRRDLAIRSHLLLVQDNTLVTQGFDLISPDSAALARLAPGTGDVPRRYAKHSLLLGYEADLRDNPVSPVLGSYVSGSAQVAGGPLGGGTYLFSKSQLLASRYRPVGTRGWVVGWRVGGGIIQPFGQVVQFSPDTTNGDLNRVPSPDRFRLGGVNSVRGYTESEITSQGGLLMVLVNAEIRIPVIGPFGLEVYVDGGNVWGRASELKASNLVPQVSPSQRTPSDMRYVLGVGGRLNLPFGPLRVDFTWNVQPDAGRAGPRWLVAEPQFAIGPAF
jgi:translocation and assembly module TamA